MIIMAAIMLLLNCATVIVCGLLIREMWRDDRERKQRIERLRKFADERNQP